MNLIPTVLGGTHEAGLRNAVYESIKEFCEHHELLTSAEITRRYPGYRFGGREEDGLPVGGDFFFVFGDYPEVVECARFETRDGRRDFQFGIT